MASKTPSEKETRENLIGWARKYGAEEELLKIFARFDELLRHCKSKEEYQAIQAMGVAEVDKLFTGKKQSSPDLLVNYTAIDQYGKK